MAYIQLRLIHLSKVICFLIGLINIYAHINQCMIRYSAKIKNKFQNPKYSSRSLEDWIVKIKYLENLKKPSNYVPKQTMSFNIWTSMKIYEAVYLITARQMIE